MAVEPEGLPVAKLATELGATLAGGPGPGSAPVSPESGRPVKRLSSVAGASPGSLVFVEDEAALAAALRSSATGILLTPALAASALAGEVSENSPALLVISQPRLAFARAAGLLRPVTPASGVHAHASIAPDVQLAPGVSIGAYAVIGAGAVIGRDTKIGAGVVIGDGVVVGKGCHIYPRVVLYAGTRLGDRVVIHAGAVLGADGFGYVRDKETGAYLQFPQQGRLIIEDNVEIGANSTIDRGALEETRIGRGTKLDNLVHVGHNVRVGEDVVIAAQTGISGSSTIGGGAIIAGQVGIADHVTIGEGVILGAQGGVPSHKQVRGPGIVFWGTPARPIQQYLRELASLARLTRGTRRRKPEGPTDNEPSSGNE